MGFFDLNIPYTESDKHITDKPTRKSTRLKLLLKAMELGYTGIAFNHTIKGVMSESDRCSISLLPLSSLLKLSPSLSTTVSLHRRLLNVPESTPFRQYTRLTVIVDSPAQGSALNSGNPVLKSYDIVAVRPLNQNAFEHACQTSEVNLIAIDFGEKLPFRLKQSMVKAAIERGVCFEITYSSVIMDAQVRRQVISNAKLLVDWTRGKNLILSSAAPSAAEIRGPYDVANLSTLLGISMERAKAAISKTCRSLLANALRKKQFYKEAIRVEVMPPAENFDLKGSGFDDWLKWDPISSGDGDLQLDAMAKSFCAASKASKPVKAINFASLIDGLPSHGLHIKDFITGEETSEAPDISKSMSAATQPDIPVAANGVPGEADQLNLYEKDQISLIDTPKKHHTLFCEGSKSSSPTEKLDVLSTAEDIGNHTAEDQTLLVNMPEKHNVSICGDSKLSSPTETDNVLASAEDVGDDISMIEEKTNISNDSDVYVGCLDTEVQDLQSQGCKTIIETQIMLVDGNAEVDTEIGSSCNVVPTTEISTLSEAIHSFALRSEEIMNVNLNLPLDTEIGSSCNVVSTTKISTLSEATHSSALRSEEIMNINLDLPLVAPTVVVNDVASQTDSKSKDTFSLASSDAPLRCDFLEGEQFTETRCNLVAPLDGLPSLESNDMIQNTRLNSTQTLSHRDMMQSECSSMAGVHEPPEDAAMEDQMQVEDHTGINSPYLQEPLAERIRRKQRTSRRVHLFPFKRLLNPTSFKKKAWRFKNKTINM